MPTPTVVVATITAAPGQEALVEQALRHAVAATRLEPGCEQYELHRDLAEPRRMVMVETWRDEQALAEHMRGAALTELARTLEGRAELEVVRLEKLC